MWLFGIFWDYIIMEQVFFVSKDHVARRYTAYVFPSAGL